MDATQKIDEYIKGISDWRRDILVSLREIIKDADSEMTEEWKWDVPVFVHDGMVCAISAFKDHVKINFFKGAKLKDPNKLINNGFTSKQHRSIDFKEGDKMNTSAIKNLVKEAVALNTT